MANEATVRVSLRFAKGTIPAQIFDSGSILRNVAGDNYIRNVQDVGTSREVLALGDCASAGLCILHNLDATNFISVYPNGTHDSLLQLKAGDWALVRFEATAPQVKADTGACKLEYYLLEN